jgi:archaellum component FlaC
MSSADTVEPEASRLIERLERAEKQLGETQARVAEFGQEDIEQLADAYRQFDGLLDRYEDQVVGDAGDVQTNIEFQSQVAKVVGNIPRSTLLYATFQECADYLKQKYFNASDFEHVRGQLEPVADIVARLDNYEEARREYRDVCETIRHEIRTLETRISELERLVELGGADLDAPTERLREPVEAYNESVSEAFRAFVAERPAREVVTTLDSLSAYPLVRFEPPPAELVTYLREADPGEMTVPKLREHAGYSRSKLDHYVDDPDRFGRVVGGHETFLSGLDAGPLHVGWPPPLPTHLRWRCWELTAAVNRIAPPVVEQLRAVAALPRETDYERLRDSAVASEQLSNEERRRLRTEDVAGTLANLRERRDRLREALADSRDPP